MKLRYKLMAVFVTISLTSIILVSVFGYSYIANDSKKQISNYLQAKAGEEVENLDKWLALRAQVIFSIANFIEKNMEKEQITSQFLNDFKQYQDISDIYIGFEDKDFVSAIGWIPLPEEVVDEKYLQKTFLT